MRRIEKILATPEGWQVLDPTFRPYRLHRFPFGIIYKLVPGKETVVIAAAAHLSKRPGSWKKR